MKNWPSILERAIEDVNEAFGVTVTEYGRYLVERGGRDRPHAACHLDIEYERTDQALKAHGDGSPIFRSKLQMTFPIQVSAGTGRGSSIGTFPAQCRMPL